MVVTQKKELWPHTSAPTDQEAKPQTLQQLEQRKISEKKNFSL